jgi:hypothetical protein
MLHHFDEERNLKLFDATTRKKSGIDGYSENEKNCPFDAFLEDSKLT